jgi:cathepsin F
VIECDAYDNACYGGFPIHAYKYIKDAGGLATEANYPYSIAGKTICLANQTFNKTCGDGICDDPPLTTWCDETCSAQSHKKVATIDSWSALSTDEEELKAWLAQHGTISVGIDATGNGMIGVFFPWMQFYHRGVATPRCKTSLDAIDHAVLIVGYGTDGGKDYWTIKNSWGTKFGEEGYFRLRRGKGQCGVNKMATSAFAKATQILV